MERQAAGTRRTRRRGQTLILALGVMFLLLLIGTVFVFMVARNLGRAGRGQRMTRAEALAWAGVRFAADQFRNSSIGADWRPRSSEPLWQTPNGPGNNLAANEPFRLRDPDYRWLSDDGLLNQPYVRYRTGEGRFLLRVTYIPSFRQELPGTPYAHDFDPNSAMLHVESVGRPGVVDSDDPTTLQGGAGQPAGIVGEFRKVEAWVPVGLVDQLLWITNRTNERGPATLGLASLRDGNNQAVVYDEDPDDDRRTGTQWFGGIRSNVDLMLQGDMIVHVHPARGEGVLVNGGISHQPMGNQASQIRLVVHKDNTDNPTGNPLSDAYIDQQNDAAASDRVVATYTQLPSGQGLDPRVEPLTGRALWQDSAYLDRFQASTAQAIRSRAAPVLDQEIGSTGVRRYVEGTRDTGEEVTVAFAGDQRTVNTGYYGYGSGLYIDNFSDIQYRGSDRKQVVNDWLDYDHPDWVGPYYIPTNSNRRPILEMTFSQNGITAVRFDTDERGMNFGTAVRRDRLFYKFVRQSNGTYVVSVSQAGQGDGHTALFGYPRNGVIFCEGSVRVRGLIPPGRQITLVSGGTIYIEGNIRRTDDTAFIGLLAQDYITLNPTAFTRLDTGGTQWEWDLRDQHTTGHFPLATGSEVGIEFENSQAMGIAATPDPNPAYLLHVEHTAPTSDADRPETFIRMLSSGPLGFVNFGNFYPPYPLSPPGTPRALPATPVDPDGSGIYHFVTAPPTSPFLNLWNYSNFQSSGIPARYERKSLWLPTVGNAAAFDPQRTQDVRLQVLDRGGLLSAAQPYWLGRIACLPYRAPLQIEIEAVMYAQNGSWFVIPPPWFNEKRDDSRTDFAVRRSQSLAVLRSDGTFPNNTADYPFYHEPLNIQIRIRGAITENMPAEPAQRAAWVSRLWMRLPEPSEPGRSVLQQDSPGFRPRIEYRYEPALRRFARYRLSTPPNGIPQEGLAYVGPSGAQIAYQLPAGVLPLSQVIGQAKAANSFVETLPVLPALPTSPVSVEGSVVQ